MEVKVKNRSNGVSVYTIPELGDRRNIRREFAAGEVKRIDIDELKALQFIPGGNVMLTEYLQVMDKGAVEELNLHVEPEYEMGEKEIKNLLLNGSLDSLLDCLDFAPTGVLDLIKKLSVDLPLNDSEKRDVIKHKLGFDIGKALENKKQSEEEVEVKQPRERRVKLESEKERRTAPKYKIVDEK